MIARRSAPRRRIAFVLVVAAWWGLGLFALDGSRLTSLQFLVTGIVALLVLRVAGVHRRRAEASRERSIVRGASSSPRTCVVVRRFGEAGDRATWSIN